MYPTSPVMLFDNADISKYGPDFGIGASCKKSFSIFLELFDPIREKKNGNLKFRMLRKENFQLIIDLFRIFFNI